MAIQPPESEKKPKERRIGDKVTHALIRQLNTGLNERIDQEHRHRVAADETIMNHLFGNPDDKTDLGVIGELKSDMKTIKQMVFAVFITLLGGTIGIIASLVGLALTHKGP